MRVASIVNLGIPMLFAASAFGQAVTASGGTAKTVPVFTGAATIGDSTITESGGNVGINTASPVSPLQLYNPSTWTHITLQTPSVTAQGRIATANNGLFMTENAVWNGSTWINDDPTQSSFAVAEHTGNNDLEFRVSPPGSTVSWNSAMVIKNTGSVGIGTSTPVSLLDVGAGILHVGGQLNPPTPNQGAYLGWNQTVTGETDFINNPGFGYGGWAFMATPWTYDTTNPMTQVLKISQSGNITLAKGASITFGDNTVQSTAFGGCAGGDYAESVDMTGNHNSYEPGDVLTVDTEHPGNFVKATERYSTLVAGVYSTKPGYVGRRQPSDKPKDDEVPMAMVGIVPTKVSAENGPIHVGDLLVSSSTPGRAMKGTDRSMLTGAVIGKALGSLDAGTGVIEVLISLQ